jgi:2-polyprenyl-6-methoxyphenol hydroxylase-like FAD-dependent oxidoreductase
MELQEFGVPIDVLWFRLRREPDDPEQVLGIVNYGTALILINRGDYFQAGFIIKKGTFENIQQQGLESFRQSLVDIAPYLSDRVGDLQDWEHIKLLSVQINRLKQWHRPGLLCIGDAAHAMSPAGGVGINLAIQDAVAAANLLARPLLEKRVTKAVVARVQERREFPARVTQRVQVAAHQGLQRVFENPGPVQAPWRMKVATQLPGFQSVVGYLVGVGVRPEHVRGVAKRSTFARLAIKGLAVFVGAVTAVAAVRIARACSSSLPDFQLNPTRQR